MKTRSPLDEARRLEKLSQAQWRRRRAEVARLIAAGEEAAARRLLAEIGERPPNEWAEERTEAAQPHWEGSLDPDDAPPAVAPTKPQSATGDASHEPQQAASQAPQKSPHPQPTPCEPGSVRSRSERPVRVAPASVAKKAASQKAAPKSVTAQLKSKRRPRRRRAPQTWLQWFRTRPPLATSLAAHSAMLTLFAMLSFATFGEPGFSLTASLEDNDEWVDFSGEVTLASLEVETESELEQPSELMADVVADVELATFVEPASLTTVSALGDVLAVSAESLMAAVPGGDTGQGEGQADGEGATPAAGGSPQSGGAPGKVSFFGAEAHAERIVFVVDNSGSMQHGRMQVTLLELGASIRRLSESQHFYVVFFSDQAYPMFFPKNVMETIPATQENKKATMQWLRTVETCLGGQLLDAMDFAVGLKPDVVFLLTDGDIRSPRVIERMTAKDAWGFPIHTLGMGARTPQHAQVLQAIAEASGGTARPVLADPTAVAKARARPIPYHNRPGPVWGSAVRPWE